MIFLFPLVDVFTRNSFSVQVSLKRFSILNSVNICFLYVLEPGVNLIKLLQV